MANSTVRMQSFYVRQYLAPEGLGISCCHPYLLRRAPGYQISRTREIDLFEAPLGRALVAKEVRSFRGASAELPPTFRQIYRTN